METSPKHIDVQTSPPIPTQNIEPIEANKRIQALDVVRGFALFGIFFMNIEWFNRSMHDMNTGMPVSLQGWDWMATYFVNYFVAGKFWTIFSILFGMGFAVMLTRSEQTGRAFIRPYIRRIVALCLFGVLHNILLWPGDILFTYSFTAAGLLIVLFGSWKWIIGSALALVGICFIPGMNSFGVVIGGILFMGLIALFIRNEKMVSFKSISIPLFSAIFFIIGTLSAIATLIAWFVPAMSEAKEGILVASIALLSVAVLSAKYHQPASERTWRAGVLIYALPLLIGCVYGAIDYQKPMRNVFDSPQAVKLAAEKDAKKIAEENAKKSLSASKTASTSKDEEKKNVVKNKQTAAEKKLEEDADRINRIKENRKEIKEDVAVLTKGSYLDVVKMHAKEFAKQGFEGAAGAFQAIALFLIGVWFVRAGVITNAKENLPLFRRLAMFGLPIGWGISILSSAIAMRHILGVDGEGYQLAFMMLNVANLLTCLAYISVVILLLHSESIFSNIKVLAPYGRMALTNYLMQSLIQASFFYGWGLGQFGMGRAAQLGFAVSVIGVQILLSHWWLSRFHYGPMEWLWRGITYWQIPKLRIESGQLRTQVA